MTTVYTVTVSDNGSVFWKNQDGKYHREDGPAIEFSNGDKLWYINGEFHRESGPAIEHTSGYKAWFINGKPHNENGPAVEFSDGDKYWYINGVKYTEEEFNEKMKNKSTKTVDDNGDVIWKNQDGKYHREDGPAIEHTSGYKAWYLNGKPHNDNGPAVEFSNGYKYWYLDGVYYTEEEFNEKMKNKSTRTVDDNGDVIWRNQDGELHREDGPAVERSDGTKAWFINGERHREDGPALERSNGYKAWFINGKRHREDGPAVELSDGYKAWCINGVYYTEEEFNKKMNTVETIVVDGKTYKLVD